MCDELQEAEENKVRQETLYSDAGVIVNWGEIAHDRDDGVTVSQKSGVRLPLPAFLQLNSALNLPIAQTL